jgi:hypothetical protein
VIAEPVSERQPHRRAACFERLAELEKAIEITWNSIEAGGRHQALTIHHAEAHHGDAHCNPASVEGTRALADLVPAAVLLPEVACRFGEIDALVGVLMWHLGRADDDVGSRTDAGDHRALGAQLLADDAFHLDLDAGTAGELGGVGHPEVFVPLDIPLPAQQLELRLLLDRRSRLGRCAAERGSQPAGGHGCSGQRFQRGSPYDISHPFL